jgi:hypothetical protein
MLQSVLEHGSYSFKNLKKGQNVNVFGKILYLQIRQKQTYATQTVCHGL